MDAATPFPPSVSSQGWIGGYHLLHKIGTGGTGTVWEAADEGGNKVALKLLHPSVADTEDARKRLLREARLVNQIKSDNISQVLDVEADAFAPFVVTELIAGQTLDKVVANAPASAEELHELAIDLADVLDDVHEANVAHRDLKPSNIVMSPEGPVLIDFGIAQSSDDGRITQTGSVTGTPGYVAPRFSGTHPNPPSTSGRTATGSHGRPYSSVPPPGVRHLGREVRMGSCIGSSRANPTRRAYRRIWTALSNWR